MRYIVKYKSHPFAKPGELSPVQNPAGSWGLPLILSIVTLFATSNLLDRLAYALPLGAAFSAIAVTPVSVLVAEFIFVRLHPARDIPTFMQSATILMLGIVVWQIVSLFRVLEGQPLEFLLPLTLGGGVASLAWGLMVMNFWEHFIFVRDWK